MGACFSWPWRTRLRHQARDKCKYTECSLLKTPPNGDKYESTNDIPEANLKSRLNNSAVLSESDNNVSAIKTNVQNDVASCKTFSSSSVKQSDRGYLGDFSGQPPDAAFPFSRPPIKWTVEPAMSDDSHANLLRHERPQGVALPYNFLTTKAAGLRHIGYGPFKKENQDEYYLQVGGFGGQPNGCCYCVFDGHGVHGGGVSAFCRRELPRILDSALRANYALSDPCVSQAQAQAQEGVQAVLKEAFVNAEQELLKVGMDVTLSGTTASVLYQDGHHLWVASAGDSRTILLTRTGDNTWQALPLTNDHRPGCEGEKQRLEEAGGRVEPKRLPSGRLVGEPRLWLQHIPGPGLMLSRSIGDGMATSVGCTAEPEVTAMDLRPQVDGYLVTASDGVWDVLDNTDVCKIVTRADDPLKACNDLLEASLFEWGQRIAADNITVVVCKFEWE